jgi:hypothetical protein
MKAIFEPEQFELQAFPLQSFFLGCFKHGINQKLWVEVNKELLEKEQEQESNFETTLLFFLNDSTCCGKFEYCLS